MSKKKNGASESGYENCRYDYENGGFYKNNFPVGFMLKVFLLCIIGKSSLSICEFRGHKNHAWLTKN